MECTPATPASIARAAELLKDGKLAIIPTDTVYGIVADIRRDEAVRAITVAKGRGPEMPLQLLFGTDPSLVEACADLTPAARELLAALGPGGWTLIVLAKDGWDSPALAGGRTVGIRVPAAPVVHALVEALGAPLAASSANRHGEPSPTTCTQAVASIGDACAIALDAGPSPAGLDSTVIGLAGPGAPTILREGAIDRATVARILGLREIRVLRSVRP